MQLILTLLLNQALASSFITCQVEAKIVSAKPNDLQVRIIKVVEGNSGFGNCGIKVGQKKKISLKEKRLYSKDDKLKLTYTEYSGMTPNGAIQTKTWSLSK
ncbi:MAG: hypothetical protein ACJAT2_003759 [Bacteriovoracaceae bacterium]|jgi:hypothetical protein